MSELFYSCAEATRLISDSMDRSLTVGERIKLRGHLLICRLCDRYRRQLRFLRAAVRWQVSRLAESTTEPAGLSPEAKERLRRRLSAPGE